MKAHQIFVASLALLVFFMAACGKETAIENPVAVESQKGPLNPQELIVNFKDIPVDAVFFNPCCNEDVHLFGTAHLVITSNIIHVAVSDITGIGLTTGYTYTGLGSSVENTIFYSNQYEGTQSFVLNLANQNGCAFRINVLLHMTLNANGVVTADVQEIHAMCG
jgi:hypothetical protein